MNMYPDNFQFLDEYFDKIMGTSKLREAFEKGIDVKDIIISYEDELNNFSELRKSYLLY